MGSEGSEAAGRRVVVLGAGASMEAGIPGSFAMAEQLLGAIQSGHDRQLAGLLNYVYGRLIAFDTARGGSPIANIDVERLVAAVRLLRTHREVEIAPFVAAWDGGIVDHTRQSLGLFGGPGEVIAKGVLNELREKWGPRPDTRAIEDGVRAIVRAEVGDGNPEVFGKLYDELMIALRRTLQFSAGDAIYLQPLFEIHKQQGELTILTLNYDLTIEAVAESIGCKCSTGFTNWAADGTLQFDSSLRLLKLHGSIDWIKRDSGDEVGSGKFPRATYETTSVPYDSRDAPLVVFGAGQKLRADGPFLDLFMLAKQSLADADELVVVGYSFRDPHINQIIGDWLAVDQSHCITVISPSVPSRYLDGGADVWDRQARFMQRLLLCLEKSESDKSTRLRVIKEKASVGLAQLLVN